MRRQRIYLFVIAFILSLSGLWGCEKERVAKAVPTAQKGVLDLRDWNFAADGNVTLSGEWLFTWQQHLPPNADPVWPDPDSAVVAKVPGTWNGYPLGRGKLPGHGFATYRLKVLHTHGEEPLALKLLDIGTACTVYVNGKHLLSAGQPGTSPETTTPYFFPTVVEFEAPPEAVDILIHVSNYDHRMGGIWKSIKLGRMENIRSLRERILLIDFFLLGAIMTIGLYHIGLFGHRRSERSSLYFGLFCFLVTIRQLSTGETFLIHLIPGLGYEEVMKILYLAFYLSVPVFGMYVRTLFPAEISRKLVFLTQAVSVVVSVLVVLLPARLYSHTMPVFQIFTLALILYGAFAAALVVYRRRSGAIVFMGGFLVFSLSVINDILFVHQVFDTGLFMSFGFFVFIFSQAYIISKRFAAAHATIADQGRRLEASERKYRMMAENVSDTIWVMDLETLTLEYISPSVEKNRGFSPGEAQAMALKESMTPDSYNRVVEILAEEMRAEQAGGCDPDRSRTVEIEQPVKGGGYRWAEATVSFIRDEKGQPTALMGVTRDISERRRAEAEIRKREAKFRSLFENWSDYVCIHDLEGNLIESNLSFMDAGWSPSDLRALNLRDIMPDDYKREFDRYLRRILAKGEDEGLMTVLKKSGELMIIEYRNKVIYAPSGAPQAVQGAARDVTERYKVEQALRESEEKYKGLVQHAPAGIYELDFKNMRFTSVNDVMCAYTGYTETELMAMEPRDLIAEESYAAVADFFKEVYVNQPEERSVEYQFKTKENKRLHVLANARLFYEKGKPNRAMVVVHDISNIRREQAEKRKLEIQLQNAKKLEALGTLAGGVAHDLNNILSGVVSYPDFLLHDLAENSPLRKPLQTIKKSGEKAAEIVRDLLTLARRGVQVRQVINLGQIARDFEDSPEFRQIISNRENIRVVSDPGADTLNIAGSETHLSKALMNLVANAVDAMPSGGTVSIVTRSVYLDKAYHGFESIPEGEYTVLDVADTGIGMPQSDLEHIFEPFYTKKVMGRSGTGLGMPVVWGTVKDHDGFIDIATEEGSGTLFSLYFPATRQEEQLDRKVHIEDYLGKGESILVVDDSKEQRELAGRMMQRIGYVVDAASSGEEAITMVGKKSYDLLILDMVMDPGINGLQTYREIIHKAPGQKAVIASGFAENDTVQQTQALGAGQYVKKPYTLEKIGLAVRSELDRPHNLPTP